MKKMLVTVVSGACVLVLVAGTLLVMLCSPLSTAVPGLRGTNPMVVLSGSMEPALHVGGLVFIRPVDTSSLKPGDIITFSTPRDRSAGTGAAAVTTHRVISVRQAASGTTFETKGDANNAADPWRVPAQSVRGVQVFSLPWLGYVSVFVRSRVGFASLVIVPALLLVFLELLDISREVRSRRKTSPGGQNGFKSDETGAEVQA
jgi:signal peptidase I